MSIVIHCRTQQYVRNLNLYLYIAHRLLHLAFGTVIALIGEYIPIVQYYAVKHGFRSREQH